MNENIYRIAEQMVQLHQKAYEIYLSLVEDVCRRTVPGEYREMWEDEGELANDL